MSNKENAKYLLIDTETSGFHPHKHGLLEVAALALDKNLNIISTFHMDLKPPEGVEFDKYAMQLNNITEDRVTKGKTYQEFCMSFIAFIKKYFSGKPIAVAQFYPFDHAYFNYVFEYCGYGTTLNVELMSNDFIDTKSLVNVINLKARLNGVEEPFPITSLSKPGGLKDKLGVIDNGFDAHTAMGDVLATLEVLKQLIKYI